MAVIPGTVAEETRVPSLLYPPGSGNNQDARLTFPRVQAKENWNAMPLYEYELCEGDCKVCGGRFTLMRPVSAAPLTQCPACKKPVRKLISSFSSPIKLKPLSITDAKKAGFTVLKKSSKGEYERQ